MKKGDRVVVEGWYTGQSAVDYPAFSTTTVGGIGTPGDITVLASAAQACRGMRPHPGDWELEHIADLVRECELRRKQRFEGLGDGEYQEMLDLVAAREAAAKPQYAEGQEVTLTGVVRRANNDQVMVEVGCVRADDHIANNFTLQMNPDDIRPVENDE